MFFKHFNPLPSHEGRHMREGLRNENIYFNPLPSHEGRHLSATYGESVFNFNPLPSHEGRRFWNFSRVVFR